MWEAFLQRGRGRSDKPLAQLWGHDPSCPHGLKDSKVLRETLQRKGGPSSTVLTRWGPTTGQMVETSEDERGDM